MAAPTRDLVKFAAATLGARGAVERILAWPGFAAEAIDTLIDAIRPLLTEPVQRAELDTLLSASVSVTARYLQARLAQIDGRREDAAAAYDILRDALAEPEPFALLHHARVLADLGRTAEAIRTLRLALAAHPPYGFVVKAERLIARLFRSPDWVPVRRLRLALLGSSSTALLPGPLMAAALRAGIALDLYEGGYGAWRQEILDPGSGLHAFAPETVLILVNHRDLAASPRGVAAQGESLCRELRDAWTALQDRHACHVIQCGFDLPQDGAWGALEDQLADGRRRLTIQANLRLSADLPSGVSFLDPARVARLSGAPLASDEEWMRFRQYPATPSLPAFADLVMAQCRAVLGLAPKVLALDLDNTLWGGVIGEDGLAGLKLGAPDPQGEAYLALQDFALDLKARGVILAICSKNNLEDAQAPFLGHDAMRLRLADFAAFRANWDDKATNLAALADELNLGLDAIVFLDDNPLERAWVRSRLPQVTVVEGGDDPWRMLQALRRGCYFEVVTLTAEDVNRHASYAATAATRQLQEGAGSVEEFLAGLGMVAEHGPVDETTLTRVTQLINKTNQFNLTTRRYTEAEVRQMAASPEWWCRWFRLSDRFGDHGLIGLVFARKDAVWRIDTFLMSCRVLGRRMEDFMAAALLTAAKAEGAGRVTGRYHPTAKNGLVADLLPRLGFAPEGEDSCWDLVTKPIAACPFIAEDASNRGRD